MEKIILRQHSPIVILRNSYKSEPENIPVNKPDKSKLAWIVAGAIVLIVIIYATVIWIRKNHNVELVNAPET